MESDLIGFSGFEKIFRPQADNSIRTLLEVLCSGVDIENGFVKMLRRNLCSVIFQDRASVRLECEMFYKIAEGTGLTVNPSVSFRSRKPLPDRVFIFMNGVLAGILLVLIGFRQKAAGWLFFVTAYTYQGNKKSRNYFFHGYKSLGKIKIILQTGELFLHQLIIFIESFVIRLWLFHIRNED